MTNSVKCIMLVDDNKIDNFFHERVINKNDAADIVVTKGSAFAALDWLKSGEAAPDIIFLDVNMPGMSGWEFIEEYKTLGRNFNDTMIVVFTSDYEDPEDEALEAIKGVFAELRPKPLTKEILDEVIKKYNSGEKN